MPERLLTGSAGAVPGTRTAAATPAPHHSGRKQVLLGRFWHVTQPSAPPLTPNGAGAAHGRVLVAQRLALLAYHHRGVGQRAAVAQLRHDGLPRARNNMMSSAGNAGTQLRYHGLPRANRSCKTSSKFGVAAPLPRCPSPGTLLRASPPAPARSARGRLEGRRRGRTGQRPAGRKGGAGDSAVGLQTQSLDGRGAWG